MAAIGLLAVTTECGCNSTRGTPTSPGPQTKTIVSYGDLRNDKFITRDVTLAVGDRLKVTLASNASTGFRWTAETQIADPAVIEQNSHECATDHFDGRSARYRGLDIHGLEEQSTVIATDYNQPWPAGTTKAWTFTANVTVQ